jgi:hypothetical protein
MPERHGAPGRRGPEQRVWRLRAPTASRNRTGRWRRNQIGRKRLAIESASACRFTVKGGGLIMVVMRRPGRRDWMSEQIARMASYPQRFHDLNGIGDRSFLFDMTEKDAALCIFHADRYIQVSAFGVAQPSKLLPALVALGGKILSRF